MNVLSLFDGMSCGQIALTKLGVTPEHYFAAEIDKHAIAVTQHNYPNTIQLGDVTKIDVEALPKIDLLLGGSPCQGFSSAGKGLNFDDPRSKLFFDFVRIKEQLQQKNPEMFFLLENVRMKKEWASIISQYLKVEPVFINSSLVSAQNRQRLYWANFEFSQPKDKGIVFDQIVDNGAVIDKRMLTSKGKSYALTASYNGAVAWNSIERKQRTMIALDSEFKKYRKLSRNECERLQTVPENYTSAISEHEARVVCGNGWTVDVIAHILGHLPSSIL